MADNYTYTGAHRLRVGTFPADEMTDTYNIESWPRQADQPDMVDWTRPTESSDTFKRFVERVIAMDGTGGTFGNGFFTWYSGVWTPLMIKYFLDNYPPGAVTVMTFAPGLGGFVVVNCTLQPIDETEGEPVAFGFNKIPIRFVNAVLAAET